MKRYALSLVAALVLGLSLASAATAAPPSPVVEGFVTISDVYLNGVPGTQLVVAPGENVSLTATWVDYHPEYCPFCVDFLAVGFRGASSPAGCLENYGFSGYSGTNTVNLGAAPTAPGTYDILALFEFEFSCGGRWVREPNAGTVIAQIVVPDLPTLPTSKDECKNGGWATFDGLFKNQGDCVSFVATGGQNEGAGA